jgi:hypothetical protein
MKELNLCRIFMQVFFVSGGGHRRDDSRCMGSLREDMQVKDQHVGMAGATKTNEMGSLEEAA